jgi:uncharacterized membrane protein
VPAWDEAEEVSVLVQNAVTAVVVVCGLVLLNSARARTAAVVAWGRSRKLTSSCLRRLRPTLLSGWALPAAVTLALALAVTGTALALTWSLPWAIGCVAVSVPLDAWCTASVMDGHWAALRMLARLKLRAAAWCWKRARWTEKDREILAAAGAALPGAEGRRR